MLDRDEYTTTPTTTAATPRPRYRAVFPDASTMPGVVGVTGMSATGL